jgi:hypothetical protein
MKNKTLAHAALYKKIIGIIEAARRAVAHTANLAMVQSYFEIGRMIVEDEQQGKSRAEYGKQTLRELSERLTEHFGKGFSEVNLRQMRNFYTTFSIQQTVSAELVRRKFTLSRRNISRWTWFFTIACCGVLS